MISKKAAMELSMSTIVIVVLSMTLLIGGIILINNILGGATESVDEINTKVLGELRGLFSENDRVVIENKEARIKANNEVFGIVAAASTNNGALANSQNIVYQLELDSSARTNCLSELGEQKTKELFLQKIGEQLPFDEFDGSLAGALVQIQIPEGTKLCTQKVFFDVYEGGQNTARNSFSITIVNKGLF